MNKCHQSTQTYFGKEKLDSKEIHEIKFEKCNVQIQKSMKTQLRSDDGKYT
jgi:hypothetical protein